MRFWLREAAGWVLVIIGLYLCLEVYNLVQEKAFFQTGPIVLMGIFIFRGGIQLLKTAIAARVCELAVPLTREDRPARTTLRAPRKAAVFTP